MPLINFLQFFSELGLCKIMPTQYRHVAVAVCALVSSLSISQGIMVINLNCTNHTTSYTLASECKIKNVYILMYHHSLHLYVIVQQSMNLAIDGSPYNNYIAK